jgi:hypothetical protein
MSKHKVAKKQRRKLFKILCMAIAIVTFWWGIWGILDTVFKLSNPFLNYGLGVLIAICVLFFDDFHLRELE